jgi:hypothetical protein
MSLSAGAINSGPSALNERLCLVEPQIYQPSEPRLILLSAPSHPSPGRRIISRAHVNPIGSARRITWHRASSKRRNFIDRGPMGDIWLSLVQCAASNRRTHRGISPVSLQNIRNRGLDGGEREIRTLGATRASSVPKDARKWRLFCSTRLPSTQRRRSSPSVRDDSRSR